MALELDFHTWVTMNFDPDIKICSVCKVKKCKDGSYVLQNGKRLTAPPDCPDGKIRDHGWEKDEHNTEFVFTETCRRCGLIHYELRELNVDFDSEGNPLIVKADYFQFPGEPKIQRPSGMEDYEFHVRFEPLCRK
jgi:hypothetical protein